MILIVIFTSQWDQMVQGYRSRVLQVLSSRGSSLDSVSSSIPILNTEHCGPQEIHPNVEPRENV